MNNYYKYGIVGMGPAGIGLALKLKEENEIQNTICFERGNNNIFHACPANRTNICCNTPFCSVISGFGGASKFSNGKISNYPAGSGLVSFFDSEEQLKTWLDKIIVYFKDNINIEEVSVNDKVKKDACLFYKDRDITYKYYDVYEFKGITYQNFISNIIDDLKSHGATFADNTEVVNITRDPITSYYKIKAKTPKNELEYNVHTLILATGALDLNDNLICNLPGFNGRIYEIGIRVEVPSVYLKKYVSAHGDLKLKHNNIRTYCVTSNGCIVFYKTNGVYFLEGSTNSSSETNLTNLALLVKNSDPKSVSKFLDVYKNTFNGIPITQKYDDYINMEQSFEEINTTLKRAQKGDINNLFSQDVNSALKAFIKKVLINTMGIPGKDIVLAAPELKLIYDIDINNQFELSSNLHIIGAATGKFRGILQSFCSGIRCGEIITRG